MKLSFLRDPEISNQFFPFTILKSLEELRIGFYTNKERWVNLMQNGLGEKVSFTSLEEADYIIDPRFIPDQAFMSFFWKRKSTITYKGLEVVRSTKNEENNSFTGEIIFVESKSNLLTKTAAIIQHDINLLNPKSNVSSYIKDPHTRVYNESQCFVSSELNIRNATLNAENGPVYIGENVTISEYAVIYGPAIIHNGSVIGPHAHIRGGSVIGKKSVVSGELKNVLILGNSNKGHYGYLGDSIIGEFCNLGAGTSCSNLKNNFHEVKIYDDSLEGEVPSGMNKLGCFIGDFSTTAVNTVLGTGATIGLMCNVFGAPKYPKYLPSFSWGMNGGYHQDKYKETAISLLSHKDVSEAEKKQIIDKLEDYYLERNK